MESKQLSPDTRLLNGSQVHPLIFALVEEIERVLRKYKNLRQRRAA